MAESAEIRFANAADVEPMSQLLTSLPGPLQFWRRMFAYSWLPAEAKPDLGAVVVAGKEIVGVLGAMYSNRVVEGRTERFCNVFGWYVRPEYRNYSVPLLSFLVKRPGLTFFNVTPADHVVPIFKLMGFAMGDDQRFICTPRPTSFFRRRQTRVQMVREEEVNEALLGPVDYQIFQDHFGYAIRRVVLTALGEVCLIITKRMYWSQVRFPRTELYYASNRDFLARYFDQILLSLLRRDKTVALHADPRQLGFTPRGARTVDATSMYPSAMLIRSDSVPPSAVDRLYSELVILP